ncbi:HesA/MoeB/ThiF family protein [Govanella unica]|uniref:Molybdopterin-synthase adenylyltransferase n=1 Tax=Govanella unica TaxID=2975056 RepID=A0A9X3Z818_9PROT|nr:molybdopterin-synthase adenylyltransferase MoeB [Govania unica]MDA5194628.1 molybdopterin-synthase adenylyltransferase MoeB [Govania unica]
MPLTDAQLDRYARHIILREVGGAGQQDLLRARVLVIGAGGLGSPLLMYLAAAGVGTLGIVDDDAVALSNLQRQILHSTDRVGEAKTQSAITALAALNPDVRVIAHNLRLTPDNAREIIAGYDIVADGCDNFATRFAVNDACVALKKTLVSAALSQFEGQLATFKPHAGPDLPCYRCFVPEAPEGIANCAEAGILGAVAGVMGTWQAVEVLKEILDLGQSLAGRILLYDALSARTRTVRLKRDPACPVCGARS